MKDLKLLQYNFVIPHYNLLSLELDNFMFKNYIESFHFDTILNKNTFWDDTFTVFSQFLSKKIKTVFFCFFNDKNIVVFASLSQGKISLFYCFRINIKGFLFT